MRDDDDVVIGAATTTVDGSDCLDSAFTLRFLEDECSAATAVGDVCDVSSEVGKGTPDFVSDMISPMVLSSDYASSNLSSFLVRETRPPLPFPPRFSSNVFEDGFGF